MASTASYQASFKQEREEKTIRAAQCLLPSIAGAWIAASKLSHLGGVHSASSSLTHLNDNEVSDPKGVENASNHMLCYGFNSTLDHALSLQAPPSSCHCLNDPALWASMPESGPVPEAHS